ncbi:MarR family transcriptional regulator [Sneathiella limimaris]|uniref:MarR family winged helix-turn-helix transcriptional regulator n=1 Tax=Sneathiella limimaris TaxID=1964213 RepID=UPI00146C35A7
MDHIDMITEQWGRERPDLDVTPMALIGRMGRVTAHLKQDMGKTFAKHGLQAASFDVLATLRRAGKPYALSPGDLIKSTMVTSGTMTNRIDQLEKAGLVKRVVNPADARSRMISLTEKGFTLIDKVVEEHVMTQANLVSGLSEAEQKSLNELLRKFLGTFKDDPTS